MAEKRRISSEFDKKIKEIEETFERINRTKESLSSNDTHPPRSKLEEEMKKEVKKLHKYKESLKTFSFANDPKSKGLLDEYKKKIDKAIESSKETKSKDTKELPPTKTKPTTEEEAIKIKEDLVCNLNALKEQYQTYKSEQETLSLKKGKSKQSPRFSQLAKLIDSHNFHINKIQLALNKFDYEESRLSAFVTLNERIKNYITTHEEAENTHTQEDFYTEVFAEEAPTEIATTMDTHKSPEHSSVNVNQESLEDTIASLSISKDDSKFSQVSTSYDTQPEPKSAEGTPDELLSDKPTHTLSSSPPSPSQRPTTPNNTKGPTISQPTSPNTHNNPPMKTQEEFNTNTKKVDTHNSIGNSNATNDGKLRGEKEGQQDKPSMKKGTYDANWYNEQLLLSYQNYPTRFDGDRLNLYIPKIPWKAPHSAFPTTHIDNFKTPQTYQLLNTDTLFFIFYYQMGTYQQYLAAQELKRRNWRFHKKSLIWFQRHEEPRVTNETSEQGDYIFFDHKNEWKFKLEIDYVFEYAYLEDELVD